MAKTFKRRDASQWRGSRGYSTHRRLARRALHKHERATGRVDLSRVLSEEFLTCLDLYEVETGKQRPAGIWHASWATDSYARRYLAARPSMGRCAFTIGARMRAATNPERAC